MIEQNRRHYVELAARAMFAVTNPADEWGEPSIPEYLREHYRRLAEAAIGAVWVT